MEYKLGALEFVFEITNRKTGEKAEVTSTPAMWAMANDVYDKIVAKGEHTNGYAMSRYINVLAILAAAKAGIITKTKGVPSDAYIAQFMNDYEVKDVSYLYKADDDEEDEDKVNPSTSDQEGDQEAE